MVVPAPASAATFSVLAFHSGTWDAAHISFGNEARPWFAAQFQGFQRYMQAGGGFFGFHVTAYNDASTPSYANWFHNDFLGTGRFATNTWGPTAETLRIDDRTHASTVSLPATIRSSVSEWYSWERDLHGRQRAAGAGELHRRGEPVVPGGLIMARCRTS